MKDSSRWDSNMHKHLRSVRSDTVWGELPSVVCSFTSALNNSILKSAWPMKFNVELFCIQLLQSTPGGWTTVLSGGLFYDVKYGKKWTLSLRSNKLWLGQVTCVKRSNSVWLSSNVPAGHTHHLSPLPDVSLRDSPAGLLYLDEITNKFQHIAKKMSISKTG